MSEYNIQMNKYNALNVEYDQLYPATKIENVDGLDKALQKKAPAGYGLGELSGKKLTASDNIDNIRVSGIYTYSWNPSNQPSGLPAEAQYHDGLLIVIAGAQNAVEQKIVFVKDSSTVNTGDNCTVHRLSLGISAWQPWEWVNPPMMLGVEYRTTERYQGKPVYALRDNFGPNTNEAVMYYGNNVEDVVYGIANDGNGSTYPWYNGFNANPWSAWFSFAKGADPSDSVSKVKVTCFAGSSAASSYTSNTILVKYTKTTD